MDDLDIQTAQLIIQLARDDLYQLDDNASSGNNQDVSDLELALAEQEREFMERWTGYGGTQIKQNAGGPSRQAGSGNGSNVGDSAVARSSTGLIRRAGSPQLRPVTPINPIDDDDDDYDDMYVNPYEPTSAASSSSNDPEPASRAAHEPAPAASRSSSSIDGDDDYDDMYVNPYEPTSAASSSSNDPEPASRAAHEPAPAAGRSSSIIGATTTSIASSALPNDDGPHPNSPGPTLEQLVEQGFALFYFF
ncbi:hypothetical protein M378DRAFT_15551 [Amanita muscaria Koide BX008]|uniref:Uncharacterized protein n=1 Tax=Amanita muscaria (strain Koide BX008) TaxID=946122 RepID=A0A0C2WAZ7_AMAMK|nr:hypothetical protein M378DRAFT_15551 [Amanita muscaria Koide BX008]